MAAENAGKKDIKLKVDENIFLKIITACDVTEAYVKWLNDYEVTKFTDQKFSRHSLETTKHFVEKKYLSEYDFLFGIFFDCVHIGNMKLGPVKTFHLSAEVGYLIGEKSYWGRGIASKCLERLVKFAVEDLKLEKLNAAYYENNQASRRVLQKCGFITEGIRLKEVIYESGRINNVLVGYTPD